jgi:sulfoxide reductase heme-binding subunit YedZ
MPAPTTLGRSALLRLLAGRDPIRRSIYLVGMMPAVFTFYLGLVDQLGADPQKTLERTLGLWALRFLILTLAITPLRRLGLANLVRYRRAFGLLAFYYAALHVAVYTLLDQGLDFAAIWADIVKRPYITVGMLAFTILLPLAVTSNAPMIRRLGGSAWQRLHRLVYLAAAAAVLHFIMLVKSWSPELVLYALLIASLLAFRLLARRPRTTPLRRPAAPRAPGAARPTPAAKRPLQVGPR